MYYINIRLPTALFETELNCFLQLDLSGFGSNSFGGGMLGGMGSPGSPVKNNSNLGSAGFPGLQAGSQMSGQVICQGGIALVKCTGRRAMFLGSVYSIQKIYLFTIQGLFGMGGTPESFGPYLGGSAGVGLGGGGAVGQSTHMKLPPQSLHLPQQQQQAGNKQGSVSGGGEAVGGLFGAEQNFSKEVDDKANSYFQAIYNRGMSVDRLLDELKKFKESPNKKDRVRSYVL